MKQKIQIALVTNFFYPFQTGSCIWIQNVARQYIKKGQKVIIVTVSLDGEYKEEDFEGIKVYRLPSTLRLPKLGFFLKYENFFLFNSRQNRYRLKEIFMKHGVQVVHTSNHLLDAIFLANRVCKDLKIKKVCTIHGAILHSGNPVYNTIMKSVDRTIIRSTMNQYDAVVSLDNEIKNYVDNSYIPRKSPLIPLCCLGKKFFDLYPSVELKPKNKGDVIKIASIGHMTENRNRCDLVRAIPAILETDFIPEIQIIGKRLCKDAEKLADYMGVSKYVKFLGEMPHEAVLNHLYTADIEAHLFFMPGLGNATLEAMALGLPVIAYGYDSLYGNVPLKHGRNIMFADPCEQETVSRSLVRLVTDYNLRIKMGKDARKLVWDHLVWEEVINQYIQLFRELLQ